MQLKLARTGIAHPCSPLAVFRRHAAVWVEGAFMSVGSTGFVHSLVTFLFSFLSSLIEKHPPPQHTLPHGQRGQVVFEIVF